MLWGFSLSFWQTVVFWLWSIAATTGAIAVAASFGSSVISYYISEETQIAADKEIAGAKAIAGGANERAAILEKDAVALRLSVVESERKLEFERAARLKMQLALNPRHITEEQVKAIIAHFRYHKLPEALLIYCDKDDESKQYANEIATAFDKAGVKVDRQDQMSITPMFQGLVLEVGDKNSFTELENSMISLFKSARLQFRMWVNIPSSSDVALYVGSKPAEELGLDPVDIPNIKK